jgi:hypothetical protein
MPGFEHVGKSSSLYCQVACQTVPPKPKWQRRKTFQRIRNEIQALEAKAKTQRFKAPIDTRLFGYHVT